MTIKPLRVNMMKHMLYMLAFGLLATIPTLAQENQDRQKLESAKIGLITNRLNLTTEQAPQFWAVYNEYDEKRKSIRRQLRQVSGPTAKPGSGDAMQGLQESVELKQKLVDLEKEYNSKFLRVITPQQLQELHNTEQMFNKMLIDRLSPQGN